jgi:aminoglycoside phosphotransferase (APT) family kinase protein
LPAYSKLYLKDEFDDAAEKAGRHRWTSMSGIGDYMLFPEHHAILYFFPNDPVIDGLRILANPKKMQRVLYQYYSKYPEESWRVSDRRLKISVMRFKPERRAVIRLDTRAVNRADKTKEDLSLYARIYADSSGQKAYDTQKRLYQMSEDRDTPRIPLPIAYLPERRMFLMESLQGVTLQDCIKNRDLRAVEAAARSLASLHRLSPGDLPAVDPRSWEQRLADTLDMISGIAPDLSDIAAAVCRSLEKRLDIAGEYKPGFVHGDLHPGQIIIDGEKAGFIDFDRSYMGDTAADIGNFIANLKLWSLKDNINTGDFESAFASGYQKAGGTKLDKDRLSFWTAFSLFELAVNPFRSLEPNWRNKTSQILKICHSLLP